MTVLHELYAFYHYIVSLPCSKVLILNSFLTPIMLHHLFALFACFVSKSSLSFVLCFVKFN